ncbi:venom dipeptidyl peptidase 4-like [Pollicipes pollicipes]|uniref:venom dipeptidyl peptidase 4-like n=1 Tax=Pollicipes pollicipes TaxID=41117 RepID=UPI001884B7DB|nr:venom dipeptidyl peptidase 4-like [Pollicipes pollicipes]
MGQNDWRVQPDNTIQVVDPKSPQRKGLVTGVEEPRKNYRGMFIAWLIIFLVLLAVVISVAIIGVRDPRYVLIGRRLRVQDVLEHSFRASPFFAAWRGNVLVYKDSTGALMQYDVMKNSSKVLFQLPQKEQVWHIDTLLSSDGRYVLERRKIKHGLRGAIEAQYSLHDVYDGHQFPVLLSRDSLEDPYLQMTLFSPGPAPPRLAVVHSGDIYLLSAVESPEAVRLTETVADGPAVLNGVTNWWYRETLLNTPQAMWFSRSGNQLMFVTFNDTELDTVDILSYRKGADAVIRKMAYPKRNGPLTAISIAVCHVEKTLANKSPEITHLTSAFLESSYLTGVQWVDEATVAVTSMSRALTSAQVSLCTAPAWHCSEVYAAANWRWVSELQPVFATGYSDFVVKTDDTEEHGEEMVEVMVQEGVKIRSKASGHRIVTLQFWDRQEHGIYYTGVEDTRPSETHLYWRPDSAAGQRAGAACLTCGVSTLLGRPCSRLTPIFGPNSDALALECAQGPVRSLHVLDRAVTRRLAELDSSRALAERMAVPHVFSETVSLGGEYVRLELILPALWEEKKGGTYLYPFVLDM